MRPRCIARLGPIKADPVRGSKFERSRSRFARLQRLATSKFSADPGTRCSSSSASSSAPMNVNIEHEHDDCGRRAVCGAFGYPAANRRRVLLHAGSLGWTAEGVP